MKCPHCQFENPDNTRFCGNCASLLHADGTISETKTIQTTFKDLLPGSMVAEKYRIVEKLGEGGMGVVYRAEDTRLQRSVALKFLSPHLTREKEARERFVQEARAASGLDHANICTIHEIGETPEGWLFIVMPYYQGETLRDRIKRGPLKLEDALDIARQLAEGLARAHGKGIVHRDVKSANVIITNEDVVKIVDFGLAKLMGGTQITKAGTTLGTAAYMSPEQAKGDTVDHRTDIWSLGVVLYEMMTGQLPFRGEREQSVVYSILNEEPVPVSSLLPDIPVELEKILSKALTKNPRSRYQHIRDFLADLHEAYGAMDLKPGWKIPLSSKLRQRKWLTSPVFWAATLVVVAGGILGLVLSSRSGGVPFQERDWVLITDFDNQTGDGIFDKSLNTALTVNLQQSRYVNVFPPARVKETLQRMDKTGTESLTEELAREVAQREGIKAVVSCRINQVGDVYNLTASIIEPGSQVSLKTEALQAKGKDKVLDALDDLSGRIRKDLGESLKDIRAERVILPRATTASLEALKAYAEGVYARGQRQDSEATALLEKAIELDPDFAMAHSELGAIYYWASDRIKGEEHFARALALLDRLTEREKLLIQATVAAYRGDRDEAALKYKLYLRKYPDDSRAWHSLGHNYLMLKRYDEAIDAFNRCLAIYPAAASAFINIATCYTATDRFQLAIENYQKAFELNPEFIKVKNLNSEYGFTYVAMGEATKAEEVFNKLLEGDESLQATGHRHLALLYMYEGKYSKAIDQLEEAARLNNTLDFGLSEYRDRLFLAAAYGNKGMTAALVNELSAALEIRRKIYVAPWWLQLAGKMFVRQGKLKEAESLLNEISPQINEKSRDDRATLNILRGEIELAKGNFDEAVDLLEKAYTLREDNYVLESVAHAYHKKGDLDKAIEKYTRIVERIDLGWEAQECWVLAHYQLGKIYQEKKRSDKALLYYQRFLEIWKDADSGLPTLEDAQRRMKTLQAPPSEQ
jgi:serine/threonine protein kinase/tetratricopeptide (TPR) repeat protein